MARIVTASPHDWSLPASTTRATSCSRMATLGRARSRGVLGSELPEGRPTVRRRARSVAGLRGMMPSRTASLSTRTQRGDCVLDRRPPELGLPLVDGAVDQARGDHPDRKMTERRKDATTETGRVWLVGRRGVDSSGPAVADEGHVLGQCLRRVDARPRRVLHLCDPGGGGFVCGMRAFYAFPPPRFRIVPANPCPPHRAPRTTDLVDVDCQPHPQRGDA